MAITIKQLSFCGRQFSAQEVSLIQEVVQTCSGISRKELANTICELLDWRRPAGGLKERDCRDLLERLENQGVLRIPDKRPTGSTAVRKYKEAAGAATSTTSPSSRLHCADWVLTTSTCSS